MTVPGVGRSPYSAHAAAATNTTCTLAITVPSPAPTSAIDSCHSVEIDGENQAADEREPPLARRRGDRCARCASQISNSTGTA